MYTCNLQNMSQDSAIECEQPAKTIVLATESIGKTDFSILRVKGDGPGGRGGGGRMPLTSCIMVYMTITTDFQVNP
jgi:hypothetical protein